MKTPGASELGSKQREIRERTTDDGLIHMEKERAKANKAKVKARTRVTHQQFPSAL